MAEINLQALEETVTDRRRWTFAQRHGLLLVGASPIVANIIGSVFNILYNHTQIEPMLSDAQLARFDDCWMVFNVVIYPLAMLSWALPIWWLRPVHRKLLSGKPVDPERLVRSQRFVINLPWWILAISCVGWLICIPVFPAALAAVPEPLQMEVVWHLVTSFLVGALIATTQSFFAAELSSQRLLYPVFFRRENPAKIPGAMPMTIRTRGVMWALSAVVSPVIALTLLLIVPAAVHATPWFGIGVAVAAIAFGLVTAWMLARLIEQPARKLSQASIRVAEGDLDVRIHLKRADEFGHLIEQFNNMVEGLQDRERLQETFGRHVGQEAARQIMEQGDSLGGTEQVITVMFVDIRNFTAHSSHRSAKDVVSTLNVFFRDTVQTVESHGGMVNKFLGDGFMALFGIGQAAEDHALQAVKAGQEMLVGLRNAARELERTGWPDMRIGIGINTGPAVVGSIGSPKRQEFTAIGDTVCVASRVESLTKTLGHPLLVTEATRQQLPSELPLKPLEPQQVKGKDEPLKVYALL